jgi:hypothetical protein
MQIPLAITRESARATALRAAKKTALSTGNPVLRRCIAPAILHPMKEIFCGAGRLYRPALQTCDAVRVTAAGLSSVIPSRY